MPKITDRFRNGWNAFLGRDPTPRYFGYGTSVRPDRLRLSRVNSRSIVNSIYNRIAVDAAMINVNHVRLNEEGNLEEIIKSDLNNVLTTEANLDQTGRNLIQDIVMSMFDEGCVAVIPIDSDFNPEDSESYKIYTARVGKILEWYPTSVRVEVYNERIGKKQELVVSKWTTAIIENPFYSLMNETNSTLQRLIRVLNQLDRTNEQCSAGKMDLIIQLPYAIKSQAREIQAEQRRKNLEAQLTGSQYGIGYIDGTEHVTQLNRSVENNLWSQAQDLTLDLYNQLGLTQSIFDGTADENTILQYYERSINPIMTAITEEFERKWLSKTARTQGQAIRYFRDPFKLIPVSQLAEISDKFTRNEIMSSNEIRSKVGLRPSKDPKADELRNSNLNHPDEGSDSTETVTKEVSDIVEEKV
jgi:ribosomal protein L21E